MSQDTETPIFDPKDQIPVVLFTGAGASKAEPLNKPTMAEFFGKLVDGKLQVINDQIPPDTRFLLTRLLVACNPDGSGVYDLEQVLTTLDLLADAAEQAESETFVRALTLFASYTHQQNTPDAKWALSNLPNFRKRAAEYFGLVTGLRAALRKLVFHTYRGVKPEHAVELYSPLFSVLVQNLVGAGHRCLPIFTTNYDRSIERIFQRSNTLQSICSGCALAPADVRFADGFGPDSVLMTERTWSRAAYSHAQAQHRLWIPYFKLHGSLGWRRRGQGIVNLDVEDFPDDPENSPVVIYPGDTKREPTEDPLRTMYGALSESLSLAQVCIVIGFSLRDDYLFSLFKQAVASNRGLHLVFVLPDAPTPNIATLLSSHSGRCHHIPMRFGEEECTKALEAFILKHVKSA